MAAVAAVRPRHVLTVDGNVFFHAFSFLIGRASASTASGLLLGAAATAADCFCRSAAMGGTSGNRNWKPANSSKVSSQPTPAPLDVTTFSASLRSSLNRLLKRGRPCSSMNALAIFMAVCACDGGRS